MAMIPSLTTSLSGMKAAQNQLDIIILPHSPRLGNTVLKKHRKKRSIRIKK